MDQFNPRFRATGVGTLPLAEAGEAVEIILASLPQIPFWPQLTARSPWEDMILQFASGLPGLKVDLEGRSVGLDPAIDRTAALTDFYEADLGGDLNHFSLTEEVAPGFFELVQKVSKENDGVERLKGQVAGPVTFCLAVKDAKGRALIHDQELAQACARGLGLKGAWQAANFPADMGQPIIFIDEPALTGFGSAFMSLEREAALALLNATAGPIREAGGFAGIHVCGNTDWSLITAAEVDIVNFDAYGFGEGFLLYPKEIAAFLERGGVIAWGLVPTLEYTDQVTAEGLLGRLEEMMGRLASQGIDRNLLAERSLLTPSCGMGSLERPTALAILDLLVLVSRRLRG